ncbi:MAG: peptidoglycan editing factor PgeF [Alphaproteobacteria bacterium]
MMNPIEVNFAPHIKAFFFDRSGGVSQGVYASLNGGLCVEDNPNHVMENRKRIAQYCGLDLNRLSLVHQIHSDIVANVSSINAIDYKNPCQADSQVTTQENLILAIQTADCVPILCADTKNNVIAAIHAGWRGAFDGIIQKTIVEMLKQGAEPQYIQAAIGPCIHQKSYEVDAKFRQNFIDQSIQNSQYFMNASKAEHFLFDLPNYAINCLKKADIEHIQPSLWDSCQNEARFFSHRRATLSGQKCTGRLISVIFLAKSG